MKISCYCFLLYASRQILRYLEQCRYFRIKFNFKSVFFLSVIEKLLSFFFYLENFSQNISCATLQLSILRLVIPTQKCAIHFECFFRPLRQIHPCIGLWCRFSAQNTLFKIVCRKPIPRTIRCFIAVINW